MLTSPAAALGLGLGLELELAVRRAELCEQIEERLRGKRLGAEHALP